MKKFLLFIAFFFVFPTFVSAYDLEISCNSTSCSPHTSPAIFTSSEIWYPGMTLIKTIRVVNTSSDTLTFYNQAKNTFTSGGLDQVFDFKIDQFGGSNLFTGKISSLYSLSSTPLVTLSGGSAAVLEYTAAMPPELGNEYQNKKTIFDLILNFKGGHEEGNNGNNNGNDNNNGNNSEPPHCDKKTPSSAPSNLHIESTSPNTVTLTWNKVTDATYYALIFTRVRDGAKYGSANIGDVSSYTIRNLSGRESYTFEIFGVNDCAPGPSASVSQSISGNNITGRPLGLNGQILGDNTSTKSEEKVDSLPSTFGSSVLSANISNCIDPWWKIYFIIFMISLPILVIFFRKKNIYKLKTIAVILLIAIGFIVDRLLFCTHSLWPLLIFISHLLASYLFHRK